MIPFSSYSVLAVRAISELEAGLAGGVGESADAPVVEVAVAVEDDLVDPLGEQSLGDGLAHLLGGARLGGLVDRLLHVGGEGRRMGYGVPCDVVHDLGVDV